MSRLLLLAILVLWMLPRENVTAPPLHWAVRAGFFVGVYAALVAVMSLWSRMLARRVGGEYLGRTLDRYNRATELARYFVPVWFAVGLFCLGWGHIVYDFLAATEPATLSASAAARHLNQSEPYWRIPGLFLGTLPAFAAWMGLWWAQYPADRAMKEQSVLYHANEGLPIHAPSGFATFFVEHLRQQVLVTIAPILLIIAARDLLSLGYLLLAPRPLPRNGSDLLMLPIAAAIFVLAPELLRRVIPTTPLPPDWPLRKRLEALCARAGLKYRDILLWRTNSSMGNAMVMGLFPRVRYVFLSDLLLETMRDEEIEAVFAHELGHIVHRHMWWYVVFVVALMLFASGPLTLLLDQLPWLARPAPPLITLTDQLRDSQAIALQEQVMAVIGLGLFAVAFGYLSRRFERQADVYAARTMQAVHDRRAGGSVVISHLNPEAVDARAATGFFAQDLATAGVATMSSAGISSGTTTAVPLSYSGPTYVGEYGAGVVASALRRVAQINNIPVAAGEWLHGSIANRMRYLHELSADADRTARFDKYMRRLYWAIVAVVVTFGVWVAVQVGGESLL